MADWKIIEGDCRDVLAGMEAGSVDAVVTRARIAAVLLATRYPLLATDSETPSHSSHPSNGGNQ